MVSPEVDLADVDKGHAWIVLAAGFFIHAVVDGAVYSFGLYLPHIKNAFNATNAQASYVMGLYISIVYIVGILSGPVTKVYGSRLVCIVGSLVSAAGVLACAWCESVYMLYVTFGAVAAVGGSAMYLSAYVSVQHYFDKRRSLANGVISAGTGFGTLAMAPFITYLMAYYGWRGTFILHAGLTLQGAILGGLLRPNKGLLEEKSLENVTQDGQLTTGETCNNDVSGVICTNENEMKYEKRNDISANNAFVNDAFELDIRDERPVKDTNGTVQKCQKNTCQNLLEISENELNKQTYQNQNTDSVYVVERRRSSINIPSRGYPDVVEIRKLSVSSQANMKQNHSTSVNAASGVKMQDKTVPNFNIKEEFKQTFKELSNVTLLKDPVYVIYAFFNALGQATIISCFQFIPEHLVSVGIEPNLTSLVVLSDGIGNMLTRLSIGWIGDRGIKHRQVLIVLSEVFLGILLPMVLLCKTMWVSIIYGVLMGFFKGALFGLFSTSLVDIVGIDNTEKGFSYLFTILGIQITITVPFIGWLADITGSYKATFLFSGSLIVLGGLGCLLSFVKFNRRQE